MLSNSKDRINPFKLLIQNWATAIDETKQIQNENLQKLLAIKTRKLSSATSAINIIENLRGRYQATQQKLKYIISLDTNTTLKINHKLQYTHEDELEKNEPMQN